MALRSFLVLLILSGGAAAVGCESRDESPRVSRAALVTTPRDDDPAARLTEAKARLRESSDPDEIASLTALTSSIAKAKAVRMPDTSGEAPSDPPTRGRGRPAASAAAWRQYAAAIKDLDPNDPEDAARMLEEKDRLIGGDK